MKSSFISRAVLLACLAVFSTTQAQQPDAQSAEERDKKLLDDMEKIGWVREGSGDLGGVAKIAIPQGYRFTHGSGTSRVLELFGNLPMSSASGMLTTEGIGPWIIFGYDDSGHVKDDEKNDINADDLLEKRRNGLEESNQMRKERGIEELAILGWAMPPRFNDVTKTLEWAVRISSKDGQGGESVNYETRLLGRTGSMKVQLVCGPEEFQPLLTEFQRVMGGFSYVEGQRYAEFREGDKVAKYGLTALVAGTGAFAAAKMGLFGKLGLVFAKLGKAAILIVIGVLAAIKKIFGKLFGAREQPPVE
ncbi:MAG: DUF2167 domain-containing protein [Prosthecobacter sp.]|uniref:DUF2167 domain-containing protein n=1 Tax=Prosthecobacter sp. TaxID=1965333 RepID=UPI002625C22C|nr:DUF2167 domain-containing protein [Prosthecobacter sp.]MCF7788683.1 DUF2167 domain-containing protein [Prosthecobacter sp.]